MNLSANRRILIVDGVPAIHEDFRKILEGLPPGEILDAAELALFGMPMQREAFELDSAYRGEDALAMVTTALRRNQPYGMAFIDVHMQHGWDGVHMIERLWQADPHLHVVICTACGGRTWDEVLARLDARDRLLVLRKPFDATEVRQLARTLTAKWDLAHQAAAQLETLNVAPAAELAGTSGAKARHYLERIARGAARAEQLIEGLMPVARAAHAPAPLALRPVDLSALARELLGQLREAAPQRDVQVEIEPGLAAAADPLMLRLALKELLDNAWKFTGRNPRPKIEVASVPGDWDASVFCVRDNGAGFDMACAHRLFRSFQRLHPATEFPGSGIGLVRAARVIALHGGRLWAAGAVDQGSTFYFTLTGPEAAQPHGSAKEER